MGKSQLTPNAVGVSRRAARRVSFKIIQSRSSVARIFIVILNLLQDAIFVEYCGEELLFVIIKCPSVPLRGLLFFRTTRNYLILLVGPLGLEPRTNGL